MVPPPFILAKCQRNVASQREGEEESGRGREEGESNREVIFRMTGFGKGESGKEREEGELNKEGNFRMTGLLAEEEGEEARQGSDLLKC